MRALVTGGAGFIGSHLCDGLAAAGYEVVCIDDLSSGCPENLAALLADGRAELRVADARDPVAVAAAGRVDRVFHLAAPASPPRYLGRPVDTISTCFEATLRALELADKTGARVVVASSSEVYGEPDEHPQREETLGRVDPVGPRACYQEGKRAAEALATSFAGAGRADVRIARIFNTYGPRMREDDGRVISSFAARAVRGEPLEVAGDGRQTRSFCYVTDMVRGLLALADAPNAGAGPVNLGNPEEVEILALANRVIAVADSSSEIVFGAPAPGDPTRRKPDTSRARRLLGFAPEIDLETGLAHTLAALTGRVL